MNKFKHILKIVLLFILGNIIFNCTISITELIVLNKISNVKIEFCNLYIENITKYAIIYIIIFLVINFLDRTYKKISIKKLNDKLYKMRCKNETKAH